MLFEIVQIGFVFFALMYVGCCYRLLPVSIMRGWFVVTICTSLGVSNFISFFLEKLQLFGVRKYRTESWVLLVTSLGMKWLNFVNPQLDIRVDQSEVKWSDIGPRSLLALNHTSFFDSMKSSISYKGITGMDHSI